MYIQVSGSGRLQFQWSVSSEQDSDYLEFYLDGYNEAWISGYVSWETKSYTLYGTGTHTFKRRFAGSSI